MTGADLQEFDSPPRRAPVTAFASRGALGACLAILAVMVVAPILILLILSFQVTNRLGDGSFTFDNYVALLTTEDGTTVLVDSIVYALASSIIAVLIGTLLAWAVTSVNVPLRRWLRPLPFVPLILPALIKDPTWIILFSKQGGLANTFVSKVFGISEPLFNVYSMPGMISAAGFFSAPMAYAIMLAPFEGLHRSVTEASRMSGARMSRTVTGVVLPMVRPAFVSAFVLLCINNASGFETPVLIGLPADIRTYSSELYQLVTTSSTGFNVIAANGMVYVALTVVLIMMYLQATKNERRYTSVTGKGHDHMAAEAPVLRWVLFVIVSGYVLLASVAPIVITILTSLVPFYSAVNRNPFSNFTLDNYKAVFTTPEVLDAVLTSGVIAVIAAVIVVIVTTVLAMIALKSSFRFRKAAEFLAMAPMAVPAVVYSIGLLLTVLAIPGLASTIYGSRLLMVIANVIVFLPIAMRLLSSALIQVHDELSEASVMSGAGKLRTLASVVAPVLRPALLYTGAVVFVLSYRELGAVVFLVANDTFIVPYQLLTFFVTGGYPMLAALNMVALIFPLVVLAVFFGALRLRAMRQETARQKALKSPAIASIQRQPLATVAAGSAR